MKPGDVVILTKREANWSDEYLSPGKIYKIAGKSYLPNRYILEGARGCYTTPDHCRVITNELTKLERIIYGVSDEN